MSGKILLLFVVGLVYVTEGTLNPPNLVLSSSQVGSIVVELNAMSTLEEAFKLHPDSLATVSQAWAQLFTLNYNTFVWSVSVGCSNLYTPAVTTFVEIYDRANEVNFRIFGYEIPINA